TSRFCNQLTLNGERPAGFSFDGGGKPASAVRCTVGRLMWVGVLIEALAAIVFSLGALPARRAIARAEMGHLIEARRTNTAVAGEGTLGFIDLHIRFRQLVEKTRWNVRRPQAMHAPIGGEIDFHPAPRAGDSHMGQAPLLLETCAPLIV